MTAMFALLKLNFQARNKRMAGTTPSGSSRREEAHTNKSKTAPNVEPDDLNRIRRQIFGAGGFLALMAFGMGINVTPFQPCGVAIVAWGVLLSVVAAAVASTAGNSLMKLKLAGSIALFNSLGLFSAVILLALDCPWMRRTNSHILIIAASAGAIVYSLKKLFDTWSSQNNIPSAPQVPSAGKSDAVPDEAGSPTGGGWRVLLSVGVQMAAALPLLAFMTYIVPKFVQMARDFGTHLPAATVFAVNATDLAGRYLWLWSALAILLSWAMHRRGGGKWLWRWTAGVAAVAIAWFVVLVAVVIIPMMVYGPQVIHLDSAHSNKAMLQPMTFGPVIEREVVEAIDFDSGKVANSLPESVTKSPDIAMNVLNAVSWMEREGMDAVSEPSGDLKGVGMKAKAVDKDAWDQLTPEQVIATLETNKRETWQELDPNRKTDAERKTPATWVFETREGGKGLLQVLEQTKAGVNVRYKLVQGGATMAAAKPKMRAPQAVTATGSLIDGATSAATAGTTTKWVCWAAVAEADITAVSVGQDVIMTLEAFPQRTFPGRVAYIGNMPVTTQNQVTYETLIDLANPDPKFKVGMSVNVLFSVAQHVGQTNAAAVAKPKITTDQIIVEDLALQMLVAIREKDDNKLKSFATDRIKGWSEALPAFAVEMREHYRQLTGNEAFDLRAVESLVEGNLAAVKCTGPKELNGIYLVLFFVKTDDGWRNQSLRNSPPSTPLAQHLANFKKEVQKEENAAVAAKPAPADGKLRFKPGPAGVATQITLPTKTIMLTRATNQLVGTTSDRRTVNVWSDSTLLPGEKLRQITRLPDGEAVVGDASLFLLYRAGEVGTSTSFSWWFKEADGFGAAEAEAATAQIREHWTKTPLTFGASVPREVFCVTNGRGATLAGSIEFVHTAPQPPDASGRIKATVQVKHFGENISFPGIGFMAKVPDGYELRATSNYGEGHIHSPAGPYGYDATWFPLNFEIRHSPSDRVSWNLQHAPSAKAPSGMNEPAEKFEIILGQPRLILSITNSPDDVFQGFLELVGPEVTTHQP